MDALLTLNIFAQSLPAALIGMALFGGLMVLPWFHRPAPDVGHGEARAPAESMKLA